MNDHRQLGRELGLFDSDPLIGAGLPYWLPAGAAIRHAIEEFVREVERRAGYQHVYSPVLGKRELYEISGHWDHYREDMFPPMSAGSEQLVLRPSLCPHHALIYRSRQRSHRELPLRLAELGGQFREEQSGVLGGLTRVRAMQLNDAHVFCPPADVAGEVGAILDMIDRAYGALGITAHHYRLSLRGDTSKYVADSKMWDRSERALAEVLSQRDLRYESAAGEGAFYGPKVDVQIMDQAGRESTLSTVQLDFYQPAQFDLSYVAADQSLQRPVMIHRSIVGSLERLVAHLTEVHAGAFPAWMAPVQVVVLPVTARQLPAAASLLRRLINAGLRAEISEAGRGTLGARIRNHRLVPWHAIVGAREAGTGTVSLRHRTGLVLDPIPARNAANHILAAAADPASVRPALSSLSSSPPADPAAVPGPRAAASRTAQEVTGLV